MTTPKVYLASGFGFSDSAAWYMEECVRIIEAHGLAVVNPWKLTHQAEIRTRMRRGPESAAELRADIGRRNADAIAGCDALLANLDGQEVDSGVAWELGYAHGLGKRCYAWRTDFRASGELGGRVNLQVAHGVTGEIETSLVAAVRRLARDLGLEGGKR